MHEHAFFVMQKDKIDIPTYDELMLPILQILQDESEHSLSELADKIALKYSISEAQRKELLPSGKYPVFRSRISWAKTYLSKANLLQTTKRAHYKITSRGKEILSQNYSELSPKILSQFEEFKEFFSGSSSDKEDESKIDETSAKIESQFTPQEKLEREYKFIQEKLAQELLSTVKETDPGFFERLVVDLLIKMGYGGSRVDAGQAIGKTNDGGIDGLIKEDRLGLDTIYIQAKRWQNKVPVKEIRDFAGALLAKKSKKGIFITTSSFPKSAIDFVKVIEPKIVLIDGELLTKLMIEHNIGVQLENSYEIKKMDIDYFSDELN